MLKKEKKTTKIVIVNGLPLVGKDTFAAFCCSVLSDRGKVAKVFSSVDKVKEAAVLLGWDGSKDAKGRNFLSKLKCLSGEAYNGPIEYMSALVKCNSSYVQAIFFMLREAEEIGSFRAKMEAEGYDVYVLLILSQRGDASFKNKGDSDVFNYKRYTHRIENDGSLGDLKLKAVEFVNTYLCKAPKRSLSDVIMESCFSLADKISRFLGDD